MNWLIWREYRLNRLILMAGLGLLLLPYAMSLVALAWAKYPPKALEAFGGAALYSVGLTQLTLVLLGGNAIAGERNDRSAQFVAYLPLSRPRRLAAKLMVTAATVIVLWGVNLLVLLIASGANLDLDLDTDPKLCNLVQTVLGYSALMGLVSFGVAWLISSLQSSPTFAVCGGLIAPLVIVMGLHGAVWGLGLATYPGSTFDEFVETGYSTICAMVAVVCFSIGTWYYLRRVEP
jgi:ABC-type transport system involved in multi-copper enzyme maturation permease subunit